MGTRTFLLAVALGVSALISTGAMAQTPGEISVQGTRKIDVRIIGQTSTGVAIKSISLSYGVSTVGLDLASAAGAEELEKRINDAALAACKEIGRQFPNATPSDAECAKAAAKDAMVRANELIQAAAKPSSR